MRSTRLGKKRDDDDQSDGYHQGETHIQNGAAIALCFIAHADDGTGEGDMRNLEESWKIAKRTGFKKCRSRFLPD
jgi:hypothetical protein